MIRYRNNRSDFWFDLINNIVMFIFLVFGIDFIPIDLRCQRFHQRSIRS